VVADLLSNAAERMGGGPWVAGLRVEAAQLTRDEDRSSARWAAVAEAGTALGVGTERLATMFTEDGRWDKLEALLTERADSCDAPELASAWRYRAARLRWLRLDDPDGAERALRRIVEETPDFAAAREEHRAVLIQLGRWEEVAAGHVASLPRIDDAEGRSAALIAAGGAYDRAGLAAGAKVQYERVCKERGKHPAAEWLLQRVSRSTVEPGERAARWIEAAVQGPKAGRECASFWAFVVLLHGGEGAEAMEQFSGAEAKGPATLATAGILLEENGLGSEGQRAYRMALDASPWDGAEDWAARVNQRVARGFEKAGKASEAAGWFRRAALGMSEPGTAVEGLERLAAATGSTELALDARVVGAERSTTVQVRAYYHHMAARTYEKMGNGEKALEHLRLAAEESVTFARVWSAWRRHLVAAKDPEGVLDLYERRIELGGSEPAARFAAAQDLKRAGDRHGTLHILRELMEEPGLGVISAALVDRDGSVPDPALLLAWWKQARSTDLRQLLADRVDEIFDLLADAHEMRELAPAMVEAGVAGPAVLRMLVRQASDDGHWERAEELLERLVDRSEAPQDLAAVHVERARIALEHRHDSAAAALALKLALDLDPTQRAAVEMLVQLNEEAGDARGLVGALSRLAAATEVDAHRAELTARIARLWSEELDDPGAAVQAWKRVLELDPSHLEAWHELHAMLSADGSWHDLLQIGETHAASLAGAARRDLLLLLAKVGYENLDDAQRGQALAASALASADPSVQQLTELFELQRDHRDWPAALATLEVRARRNSDPSAAARDWEMLAHLRLDRGSDPSGVSEAFARALENDPASMDAHRYFALRCVEQEQTEKALEHFAAASAGLERAPPPADPDAAAALADFHFRHGEALATVDRDDEALRAYEAALGASATHLPSMQAAAAAHLAAGAAQRAADLYRGVLRLSGDTGSADERAELQLAIGRAELGAGEVDAAARRFRKVLELQPGSVTALSALVDVSEAKKDWKGVLSGCNQLIKASINDLQATVAGYRRKARILEFALGWSDKSIPHYGKLLEYVPNDAEASCSLAQALVRQGDHEKGLVRAEAAIKTGGAEFMAVARGTAAAAAFAAGKNERAGSHVSALRAGGHPALADALVDAARKALDGRALISIVRDHVDLP
jgi:lipopolysaccharide biosynthesis regulator YciM